MFIHEAEFYGITPLVKRLKLCEEMTESPCGDILFLGSLQPPEDIPLSVLPESTLVMTPKQTNGKVRERRLSTVTLRVR